MCAISAALASLGSLHAQEQPAEKAAAKKDDKSIRQFIGVGACVRCHEEPSRRDDTNWCRLTEYAIWQKEDKHSQAYAVLLNDRSKQMGKYLGIANVAADNRCLSCHAVVATEAQKGDSFKIEDGVSCDACHGPAGDWLTDHWREYKKWRTLSAAEKERDYGMKDVRDPLKRTQMCLSCHLGDAKEGKVVTHAMYAAGHPPLPGFEIETYAQAEPRHWRTLAEKLLDMQKQQKADPNKDNDRQLADLQKVAEHMRFDPSEAPRTRLVVGGGVAGLRQQAALFAALADSKASETEWPELAQFDCYACHHDLRVKSWRQERGYPGKPGRPRLQNWPVVLPELAVRITGGASTDLDQAMAPLQHALDAQPFGRPSQLGPVANSIVNWCDELTTRVQKLKFDQPMVAKTLRELAAISASGIHDYDTARELAWAMKMVYSDLSSKPANAKQIEAIFARLDEQLRLKIPVGAQYNVLATLPQSLAALNDYDPASIQREFVELEKLLK